MILQTFKAVAGPQIGNTLTLPPVDDSLSFQGNPDRTLGQATESTSEDGVWLFNGANPMLDSYGEVPLVYIISQAYLTTYPTGTAGSASNYLATYGGLEWAINDIRQYCKAGGLGTLTQPLGPGVAKVYVLGTGYVTFTTLTCTAIVRGQPKVEYLAGAPIAKVTINWMNPVARWTTNSTPATTVPFP